MKPSRLAAINLRKIASAIDKSKNPNRDLVIQDLKKILAAVNESDAPGSRAINQRIIAEYVASELEYKNIITEQQVAETTSIVNTLLSGTNFDFLE
jgi:hypothetical protein